MGADEYFDVAHRLSMLGVYEIGVLPIHVKKVLEHAEYKTWDGKDFGKGTETKLMGEGYKKGNG